MFSDFTSDEHTQAFAEFLAYKTRVPVRGAIMLNEKMDEVVLVKGWKKGANWSFPRGKINKDEPDLDCAVREVYEETGYELKGAGLVSSEEDTEFFEMDLREQNMKLFVFRGVPTDTLFEPRTRKEISKIMWWKLSDLPTLKKKKQQQEGQGGDFTTNSNKFYMVAPFLPKLKKYIAAQKKLDKTRKASVSAGAPMAMTRESLVVEDHEAEENMVAASSNEEMARLLNGLRQSAEPIKATNLPEVTTRVAAPEDIAAQLKSFLGVPPASSIPSTAHETVSKPPVSEPVSNPKANSLLALLQSKPAQPAQLLQTPKEQVIKRPSLPPSPPHPQHQLHQFSSMPPPPTFPTQDQLAPVQAPQPQPPQIRSIPPPQQPAVLVPRNSHNQHRKPFPRATTSQQPLAPYQRTGDPQFAQYAQGFGKQLSAIPPASTLPPPKLNAQSSALLNLFRIGPITKAPEIRGKRETSTQPIQSADSAASDLNVVHNVETHQSGGGTVLAPGHAKSQQTPRPTNAFIPPPQMSLTAQLVDSKESSKSKSGHHEKLLNLFRSSPTITAKPSTPAGTSLQLPSTPVELSALPTTPNHSRGPSKINEPKTSQIPTLAQNGSTRPEKRVRKDTVRQQNPSVSATVNGPLNVPQFEMLAKASRDAKQASYRINNTRSPKRSPVAILARPRSSQGLIPAPVLEAADGGGPVAKERKAATPGSKMVVTPSKKPPPAPDLKAQEAPPKPFHPQILRRPAHTDDSNEPSPIQPLPSPIHTTIADRQSTLPKDHKRSLLSLFTGPSPAVSPSSAVPANAIDSSAFISPMTGPSPQEQAEAAFARLTQSVGELSRDAKAIPGPNQPPMLRTASIANATGEAMTSGRSSGKQTPTVKNTPVDKNFLLGYLNKVLEGGR